MHEAYAGNIRLDDVDFLQRSDNQKLKIEALEQFEAIAGGLIGAAPERLIYDHETEATSACRARLKSKLVGEAGGENCISKFFFLSSGLAACMSVVLEFAI